MNKRYQFAAVALIGVAIGFLLHGDTLNHTVQAAPNEPSETTTITAPDAGKTVSRLQVSAYGAGNLHGCYVVDTATGELWHSDQAQPELKRVSGGLSFVH